jgi:hypothetical protein
MKMWNLAGLALLAAIAMAAEDPARQSAVAAAKALLVKDLEDLGLREDEISVRTVTATEWPDAALGCPAKGKVYAQVITPGFRVVLEARGKVYPVHTGQGRAVRCDSLRKGRPLPEKKTQD